MKKQFWIILYLLILIGDITGIQLQNSPIQSIFKPLLIPTLIGYFLSHTGVNINGFKKWVVMALLFSLAGDVLLMFQEKKSIFFLLGLSAFLLAHICYILFFNSVRIKEKVKGNFWFLLIVVLYYAGLMYWLSPFLADMKIPVMIYGIVISSMLMLALNMLFIMNKPARLWMLTGAVLFVISDSVLAVNKFYQTFEVAGIVIMITYGLAQLFITKGAIKYLRNQ